LEVQKERTHIYLVRPNVKLRNDLNPVFCFHHPTVSGQKLQQPSSLSPEGYFKILVWKDIILNTLKKKVNF